jgi:hypothetical protein
MDEFNLDLCTERHGNIKIEFNRTDTRLKKVENRFLMIITALALNLLGVVATLLVILSQSGQ